MSTTPGSVICLVEFMLLSSLNRPNYLVAELVAFFLFFSSLIVLLEEL